MKSHRAHEYVAAFNLHSYILTEHAQHNKDQCRFRRAAFYSQLEGKVGNIVDKATANQLIELRSDFLIRFRMRIDIA
jgi:hypothetical protein